jgi:hypothetical protein
LGEETGKPFSEQGISPVDSGTQLYPAAVGLMVIHLIGFRFGCDEVRVGLASQLEAENLAPPANDQRFRSQPGREKISATFRALPLV